MVRARPCRRADLALAGARDKLTEDWSGTSSRRMRALLTVVAHDERLVAARRVRHRRQRPRGDIRLAGGGAVLDGGSARARLRRRAAV